MNADYWGRQSVVISKNKEGFTFANPGRLRISKSEAIGGCTSDPRNSTILKFFFLIRFGERAGSGLNGIMYVWNHVYHTEASIDEKDGEVDRTILTLPYNGHEQDVDAMLQLYDDYEQFSNDVVDKSLNRIQHTEDVNDRTALNYKIPCSGVISRPAASTSCRSFFITSAGIHLRSTLTVRTRLRLRTMSIGA